MSLRGAGVGGRGVLGEVLNGGCFLQNFQAAQPHSSFCKLDSSAKMTLQCRCFKKIALIAIYQATCISM